MPHQLRVTEGRSSHSDDTESGPHCPALILAHNWQATGWGMHDSVGQARGVLCMHHLA